MLAKLPTSNCPSNDPMLDSGQIDYGPQEHSQFRGRPYWCKAFWASEDPVVPGINCEKTSK